MIELPVVDTALLAICEIDDSRRNTLL